MHSSVCVRPPSLLPKCCLCHVPFCGLGQCRYFSYVFLSSPVDSSFSCEAADDDDEEEGDVADEADEADAPVGNIERKTLASPLPTEVLLYK